MLQPVPAIEEAADEAISACEEDKVVSDHRGGRTRGKVNRGLNFFSPETLLARSRDRPTRTEKTVATHATWKTAFNGKKSKEESIDPLPCDYRATGIKPYRLRILSLLPIRQNPPVLLRRSPLSSL